MHACTHMHVRACAWPPAPPGASSGASRGRRPSRQSCCASGGRGRGAPCAAGRCWMRRPRGPGLRQRVHPAGAAIDYMSLDANGLAHCIKLHVRPLLVGTLRLQQHPPPCMQTSGPWRLAPYQCDRGRSQADRPVMAQPPWLCRPVPYTSHARPACVHAALQQHACAAAPSLPAMPCVPTCPMHPLPAPRQQHVLPAPPWSCSPRAAPPPSPTTRKPPANPHRRHACKHMATQAMPPACTHAYACACARRLAAPPPTAAAPPFY